MSAVDIESRIRAKAKEFETLDEQCCFEIVLNAKALSLDECFDYLLISKQDLSPDETSFAELLHRRGRAIGVKDAADKLFQHMSTKAGGQSALEYLKQFSGDFAVEVQQSSGSGFQFNVTIPEPTTKTEAKVSTGQ